MRVYRTIGPLVLIYELEGLHNLFSKSKGADQLHGDRTADLCLCFCIHAKCMFSHEATDSTFYNERQMSIFNDLGFAYSEDSISAWASAQFDQKFHYPI